MYGQINSTMCDNSSLGFLSQYQQPTSLAPPLQSHSSSPLDFNCATHDAIISSSSGRSSSSSYIGSPSSPPSCCTSSHPQNSPAFLHTNLTAHSLLHPPTCLPVDLDVHPAKGNLISNQRSDEADNGLKHYHRGGSLLETETVSIILQGMTKACPYSPQAKKERIERYRTKRNRRNFNKKIQYACRKTLADSRPRIRGRFARNDGNGSTNNSADLQWRQVSGEEENEDYEHWIYLLHSISPHIVP